MWGLWVRGRSRRALLVIPERSARRWGIYPYLVAGRQKFRRSSLTQTHTSLQPPPRLTGRNGRHPAPATATPELSWRTGSPHAPLRRPAEGKCLRESPAEPVFSLISPELGELTTPPPRVCPVSKNSGSGTVFSPPVPASEVREWHRAVPSCPGTTTQGMAPVGLWGPCCCVFLRGDHS